MKTAMKPSRWNDNHTQATWDDQTRTLQTNLSEARRRAGRRDSSASSHVRRQDLPASQSPQDPFHPSLPPGLGACSGLGPDARGPRCPSLSARQHKRSVHSMPKSIGMNRQSGARMPFGVAREKFVMAFHVQRGAMHVHTPAGPANDSIRTLIAPRHPPVHHKFPLIGNSDLYGT